MSGWGFRTNGYQIGIALLYVFTTLFFIGIIAPAWLVYDKDVPQIRNVKLYAGILLGCRYQLSRVGTQPFEYTRCGFGFEYAFQNKPGVGGWVHAVEAFEILSFITLLVACIYAGISNCFSLYPPKWNRAIEILTAIAGILAFTFCMLFVGKLRESVERDVFYFFSWSFYLSVVSSIALVVSSLIIGLFNEYIPPPAKYSNQGAPSVSYSNVSAKPGMGGPGSVVSYGKPHDELYDPRIVQAGYNQGHGTESDL